VFAFCVQVYYDCNFENLSDRTCGYSLGNWRRTGITNDFQGGLGEYLLTQIIASF